MRYLEDGDFITAQLICDLFDLDFTDVAVALNQSETSNFAGLLDLLRRRDSVSTGYRLSLAVADAMLKQDSNATIPRWLAEPIQVS